MFEELGGHVFVCRITGECVLSLGTGNWERVLNTVADSNRVAIATYSLSKAADFDPLQELAKAAVGACVEVVTNIPSWDVTEEYYKWLEPW